MRIGKNLEGNGSGLIGVPSWYLPERHKRTHSQNRLCPSRIPNVRDPLEYRLYTNHLDISLTSFSCVNNFKLGNGSIIVLRWVRCTWHITGMNSLRYKSKNVSSPLCLINYGLCHEDIWGNGVTAPPIVTSARERARWGVSFMLWPLYRRKYNPRHLLDRRLGETQMWSGGFR